MKRLRDEVYVGSQFKRPFSSSRVESYGQAQISGGGGVVGGTAQKLTTNDALTYLKEVKDMFHDQREKYDQFLDVMKDFKAQRIHTDEVIEKVKELFEGHDSLILGFNTFLPKGFEITVTNVDVPPKKAVEFEEAIHFVNKIKKRFQNDDRVYKSFLDILNMYRKEHKDINEVYRDVAILFDDHPDLLNEFTRFLPDPSGTLQRQHIQFGPNFYKRCEKQQMSSFLPLQQAPSGKLWHRERIFTNESDRDMSAEFPNLDDEGTMMNVHKDHRKQHKDRRNYGENIREADHEINGCKDLHLSDKRKSAKKVEDYGANPNFNNFADKNDLKGMYNQEFIFCEKVKERLCNTDDYQDFLKLLHIYSTEIINKDELKRMVADLLKKYPDLMDGFNEFLGRCENIDGFIAGVMSKKTLWNEEHIPRSLKVEERDKEQKHDLESTKEKDRCKEKYIAKSIQELDLSECQRCTPSYRLFPDDYPIPSASQRSDVGAQVLNDIWVSVTSGSEDYSFKHMRRNQYEESLFRCEDDRFELDMLLESVTSTSKRAEELLNYLNDEKNNLESPFHIEDHFTALNLRCVERLYGDHGLDVTDILRRNPSLALPVILTRLKQKQEEWRRCRTDFNKVWADIYAKNHYKSLDHRSFYFKQQDSKNLCTKSLLGEIKDIKEKKQSEEDVLLAGSKQDLIPDLEYVYSDMSIHDDLYKLVKYSCEEVCTTKDHSNKVMQLWAVFLEPLIGCDESHGVSDADNYKQLKSSKNVDEKNSIVRRQNSCHSDSIMEDGLNKNNFSHRNGPSSSPVAWLEKECMNTFLTNVSILNFQTNAPVSTSTETSHHVTNLEDTFGKCTNPGPGIATIEDEHETKQSIIGRPSVEGNGMFTEGDVVGKHNDPKIEMEEGELSPNADFEEDNFVIYRDVKLTKSGVEKEKEFHEDERCENGAMEDEDDDDSGNRSEAGENVSRSESIEEEDPERNAFESNKIESEGEADDEAHLLTDQHFLSTAKPLSKHMPVSVLGNQDSRVFYGNDNFYMLLRLHQILYERILCAKTYSASVELKRKASKETSSSNPYARFMIALYSLLDGSSDNAKFEDDCRDIIGNQSYVLFTLDKLICKLVKQLQAVATDEVDNKLLQLYEYEKSRRSGKFVDSVYYENSRVILPDENIYRFECLGGPSRLSIQLMENGNEKPEAGVVAIDPNFTAYLIDDFLSCDGEKNKAGKILLKRNKSKYGGLDEPSAALVAMENVELINGLECKIACNSSKISYVLDTEDFFFRTRRKRNASYDSKPVVERFHRLLYKKCNSV